MSVCLIGYWMVCSTVGEAGRQTAGLSLPISGAWKSLLFKISFATSVKLVEHWTPFPWKCVPVTEAYPPWNSYRLKKGPALAKHKDWTVLLTPQLADLCQYFYTTWGLIGFQLPLLPIQNLFSIKKPFYILWNVCRNQVGWVHYLLAGGSRWRNVNRSRNHKKLK